MASSTTNPMARTRPKSDSVLMEKPNNGKTRERANQRDRHRQQRDQRRAPALQENEHHQHHQRQRLPEGLADFADAFGDGLGGVNR